MRPIGTRRGGQFLICPSCVQRGVYLKTTNEEWWVCRYCEWSTCAHGEDAIDRQQRARLAQLHLDLTIWVTDIEESTE